MCHLTKERVLDNNELNRRIRYSLQLDDADAVAMMQLAGTTASASQAAAWRTREGEPGFEPCPREALVALLDGLILDRRGPPPRKEGAEMPAPAVERHINNAVLKQLRIALALRTEEVHQLMVAGGGKLAKSEVGAFFRKPDARNFRVCGDQVLRWFLAGLAERRETD